MEECVFCKIAEGEIPSKILYEDDDVLVFEDTNPQAPVHLVIVPRQHIATIVDVPESKGGLLGRMFQAGKSVAREKGLESKGYRFVLNYGKDGGQLVQHIHLHLLGGRLMAWPPG